MSVSAPVLWHIPVSHYSEKARWALDYKGVEHERRAPLPGLAHGGRAVAHPRRATRRSPSSQLDGERIGDSTAIIAALEQRSPGAAAVSRRTRPSARRALELEDFFDEELGPQIAAARLPRAAPATPSAMAEVAADDAAGADAALRRAATASRGAFGSGLHRSSATGSRPTRRAGAARRARSLAALDRLEAELERGRRVPRRRRVLGRRPDRGGALLPAGPAARGPADARRRRRRRLRGVPRAARASAPATAWVAEMFAPRTASRRPRPSRLAQSISTIASTSTGTSNGSCAAPIAERAWRPASGPQTSSTRSVKPLITAGGLSKPGRALDEAERLDPAASPGRGRRAPARARRRSRAPVSRAAS